MGRILAVGALVAVALLAMPRSQAGNLGEVGEELSDGDPSRIGDGYAFLRPERAETVEILLDYLESRKLGSLFLGQTVSVNLSVTSNCLAPDSFDLAVEACTTLKVEFKAAISPEALYLFPGQTKTAVLNLTAPKEFYHLGELRLNISVVSRHDQLIADCLKFNVWLVPEIGTYFWCEEPIHATLAGVRTQYMVHYSDWQCDDLDLNITCSGPPGWSIEINPSRIKRLARFQEANITLNVTPPFTARRDEVGIVSVTVSHAKSYFREQMTIRTVVSGSLFLGLTNPEPEKYAHPGDTVAYTFYLSNSGNMTDPSNVSLEVESTSGLGTAWLEQDLVVLLGSEICPFVCKIAVPKDAMPGMRIHAKITARYKEGGFSVESYATVIVDSFPCIEAKADGILQNITPGGTASYNVLIQSFPDSRYRSATFTIWDRPAGWHLRLWPIDNAIIDGDNVMFIMEPGEARTFVLFLTAPQSTLCGDYRTALHLNGPGADETTFEFTTRILQMREIMIASPTTKSRASAGDTILFPLTVANMGNGRDTIDILIEGIPPGWKARIADSEKRSTIFVNLEAGEARDLTLEVTVPSRPDGLARTLGVIATSSGGASATARFTVDVRLPDLYMTGLSYRPKRIHTGDNVTINLTVYNEGPGDAAGVYVKFRDGDGFAGMAFIDRLPANSSRNVSFLWMARPTSSLEFTADPDNLIVETDERNNRVLEQLWRSNPSPDPDIIGLLARVAPALLAGLPGAGLGLMLLQRRRQGRGRLT